MKCDECGIETHKTTGVFERKSVQEGPGKMRYLCRDCYEAWRIPQIPAITISQGMQVPAMPWEKVKKAAYNVGKVPPMMIKAGAGEDR